MLPPVLSRTAIHAGIDQTCKSFAETAHGENWTLRRAVKEDFVRYESKEARREERAYEDLLYGIVASQTGNPSSVMTTFYFAYSTWDGRYLYLDNHWPRRKQLERSLHLLIFQALAQIALSLDCARFTWQHFEGETGPRVPKPLTLEGWLTLYWSQESIQKFLACQGGPSSVQEEKSKDAGAMNHVEDVFGRSLGQLFHEKFALRLATADDVDTIGRLVQGLADYEKEPDAVHVTADLYKRDGFGGKPLFYCLLIDHKGNDGKPVYACGMAFCYIGCRLSDGTFLYLEDLFIESDYRGGGAGKLVMHALALIGSSLGCSRLVWQALDWNAPALGFYDGLGAKVQDGLITTRYEGKNLKLFAGGGGVPN